MVSSTTWDDNGNDLTDRTWTLRLTPAGKPDAAYGTGGSVLIANGLPRSGRMARDVDGVALADGAWIVNTYRQNKNGTSDLGAARISPDGTLAALLTEASAVHFPDGVDARDTVTSSDGKYLYGFVAASDGGLRQPAHSYIYRAKMPLGAGMGGMDMGM